MAIKLIEVACTNCGAPMKLPEHVVDLPADAKLCERCAAALLRSSLRVLEQAGMPLCVVDASTARSDRNAADDGRGLMRFS